MDELTNLIGGSANLAFPQSRDLDEVQRFFPHIKLLSCLSEHPNSSTFSAQYESGYDCVVKAYTQPYDKAGAGALEIARAQFEYKISKRLSRLTPDCLEVGHQQGLIFTVWDFAKGTPLTSFKSSRSVATQLKDQIVERCAYLLDHVHEAGVLHLDIKPSHIFIELEPTVSVQFIDWGLACDRDLGPRPDHALFATPAFTRPERLNGGAPCRQDDWFALEKSLAFCLGPLTT